MSQITLIATQPQDLEKARGSLVAQLKHRVSGLDTQIAELRENIEIATKNKWRTSALKSAIKRFGKMRLYYSKVVEAVQAGYHIVPNMPMDVFAIRTDRKRPSKTTGTSSWNSHYSQASRQLPSGEAEYKDPVPFIRQVDVEKNEQGHVTTRWYRPTEFDDVGFPVALVNPAILEATSRAAALKIFDEIGILPQRGCGDPMVLGRIRGPNYRECSFVVAWWLDPSDI